MSQTAHFPRNPVALVCAGLGLLLLGIAFHFNVNPVDCGAVRGGLQHQSFLYIPLVVATVPAMYVGMVVEALTSGTVYHSAGYFAGAYVGQFLIYFVIGYAISSVVNLVRRKREKTTSDRL